MSEKPPVKKQNTLSATQNTPSTARPDGRKFDQLRTIRLTPHPLEYPEGSCMVEFGRTRVLCSASLEANLPKWLQGKGHGWVTAEYGMLPRSTHERMQREKAFSGGRSQEISRLIGRSLRAAVDLKRLGERQIMVDCDVLQADGGTRTAAITGGFVALALALQKLKIAGLVSSLPLRQYVAAVSIGIRHGHDILLDLNYEEDQVAETDMNFVVAHPDLFIEIQGTAERQAFRAQQVQEMMQLALTASKQLFQLQSEVIGTFYPLEANKE